MGMENQEQNKSVQISDEVLKQVTGGSQDDRPLVIDCPRCMTPVIVTVTQIIEQNIRCSHCGFVLYSGSSRRPKLSSGLNGD